MRASYKNSNRFNKDKENLKDNYELFVNARENKNYFSIVKDSAILANTRKDLQIEIKQIVTDLLSKIENEIKNGKELTGKYRRD